MSGFSGGKLEAGRNELGLCTARYESQKLFFVCSEGLARFLAGFGGVLWADHVRFHSCHPYIERLPTL